MGYFPLFVDLKNKKCLIVGGGRIAYRKILALLDFEADITVVAPSVINDIAILKDRIYIQMEEYKEKDLEGAFLTIAATNNSDLNGKIAADCRTRNILVNTVDEIDRCDFLFPAYIKKGNISIGITTSGHSPVMAGYLKKEISENLPDYYEPLIDTLGSYREYVKNTVPEEDKRADIMKELVRIGLENKGYLTETDVQGVILKMVEEGSGK